MAAGDIEMFRQDGLWFNRIEGDSRTLGEGFEKEKDAIAAARRAQLKFSEEPSADHAGYGTNSCDLA